jgi:hypothetical protein
MHAESSQIIITLCVLTKISNVQQTQNYYCSDLTLSWGREEYFPPPLLGGKWEKQQRQDISYLFEK